MSRMRKQRSATKHKEVTLYIHVHASILYLLRSAIVSVFCIHVHKFSSKGKASVTDIGNIKSSLYLLSIWGTFYKWKDLRCCLHSCFWRLSKKISFTQGLVILHKCIYEYQILGVNFDYEQECTSCRACTGFESINETN